MSQLMSKLMLFAGSLALLLYYYQLNTETIVLFLVAFIISAFASIIMSETGDERVDKALLKNSKIISSIILCIYALSMCYLPALFLFVATIVYDAWRHNLKVLKYILLVPIIYNLATGFEIYNILAIIMCLIAALLAELLNKNERLEKELITLRDTSVEREIMLEKNNKLIRQNQDDNIYMATLQERNRIAREIHDNVGHMLTRSILQVGALKVINKEETMKMPLENLHETLNTAMTNIRESVYDLHDESVDLESTIKSITNDIEAFKINVDYDMSKIVPKNIKYAFIAIIKEAVNNAVKYSNGDTITLLLREHPGFYQLLVEDNGTIDSFEKTGIGISNMEERVKEIGGTIKITTGKSFRILISVMKQ